jgi:hypothetical protein
MMDALSGSVIILFFSVITIGNLFSSFPDTIDEILIASTVGFIGALISVLVSAPVVGLSPNFRARETPNYAVIASLKSVCVISIVSYPAGLAMFSLVRFFTATEKIPWQGSVIVSSAAFAIFFGFWMGGGVAVVQHIVLRFLLHRQGHIPHNYAQFLRYTTERRLTQQIGGRFRFIHRELLDHFADMEERRRSN